MWKISVIFVCTWLLPSIRAYANESQYVLSDSVEPNDYHLRIVPNVKEKTFQGVVHIGLTIKKSTDLVVVHCDRLTVRNVVVSKRDGGKIKCKYSLNEIDTIMTIATDEIMEPSEKYTLMVQFRGRIQNKTVGFFWSTYETNNQTKYVVATQFEPNYARNVFPCFDEPSFKTPFTLVIAKYKHEVARSNMPVEKISKPFTKSGDRAWVTFRKTIPMPTYLLAWVLFEYDFVGDADDKYFVWTRPDAVEESHYALRESKRIVRKMEEYTGIKYPLPKLDLIALPRLPGGMENWGIVTYGEQYLLCDEMVCSSEHQTRVSTITAHELAHQWFGNYATIKWWSYLWLKEGFAKYFEFELTNMTKPSWNIKKLFTERVVIPALFFDDRYYFHPLTHEVHTPTEVRTMYDYISYHKGASVLRMFEHVVSSATFHKALRKFLKKSQVNGGLVEPDNLFDALEKQIVEDDVDLHLPKSVTLTSIMKGWTETAGYPLVKVSVLPSTGDFCDVLIEQEPYKDQSKTEWIVPITYTKYYTANFNNTKTMKWLMPNQQIKLNREVKIDKWILLNLQQTGFYRVNYDIYNWELLVKQLKNDHRAINVFNRAQLIDDSHILAMDGKTFMEIPIAMNTYLEFEEDLLPWMVSLRSFRIMSTQMKQDTISLYASHYLSCLQHEYYRIGFEMKKTDDHLTRIGRANIVYAACKLGLKDCIKKAYIAFNVYRNDLSQIDPDLKEIVFCTMVRLDDDGTDPIIRELEKLLSRTKMHCDRLVILAAMTCNPDKPRRQKAIRMLIEENLQINDWMSQLYDRVFSTSEAITDGLELIEKMLSELNPDSDLEVKRLTDLLPFLVDKIHFKDQLEIVSKIIDRTKKLNEPKLDIFVQYLEQIHLSAKPIMPTGESLGGLFQKYRCSAMENLTTEASITTTAEDLIFSYNTTKKSSSGRILPCVFLFVIMSIALHLPIIPIT